MQSVDEDERYTYQPLRLRRGLLLEGIASEEKKGGTSTSNPVSTDGGDRNRDVTIPAGIGTQLTNAAKLIDRAIAEVR